MQPNDGWLDKVLVGTVRSDEQFNACITNNFYYAPISLFRDVVLPVSYVALYRAQNTQYPGIHFFAKIKKTKKVKRKKIRFPMTRDNRDEDYFLFETEKWERLDYPIPYFNTSVYTVKETTLFLLKNCKRSHELFFIRNEQEYSLYVKLMSAAAEHKNDQSEISFELDSDVSVLIYNGYMSFINKNGEAYAQYSVDSFVDHPETIFESICKSALY